MADCNEELAAILKGIETQLADIKREMPKEPYYGDLLQDIVKAIEDLNRA
ncbi:MAG TPA: hypothetical protein G4O15_00260 [Dehalococcoidia bacterium]|nr:hypothetical protein [Dehalococcoidia bacterium]